MKRSYGYETELLGWPGNSNGVVAVLRVRKYDLDAASCKQQIPGRRPRDLEMSN
jgi:hypothetical protein